MYEKVKEPIREGMCTIEQETEEGKAHERSIKSTREDEKHQGKRGKAYQHTEFVCGCVHMGKQETK